MKNYKIYLSSLFTLLFLGAWSNLANAAACDADGTAAAPMTVAGCDTAPDIYKTMVFEMGLCTTTPTLANRTTACTSVSSIPAGAVITVAKGADTALPGAFTRPVNASYTHGYVIMAPEFRLTATKTFSSNLSGQSNTAGDTCWTLAGSTRDSNVATAYDGATPTVIGAQATWLADCGTAASAAPAETIIIQDAFGGDTIESGNGDATAQATVNGVTIKAHLTDDTMAANATTSAAVTRLVGFVTFATPVAITDATTTFTASFRTTQGMELDPTGGGDLKKMSSGPFILSITVN